jgi:hypothetical protein
VRLRLLLIATCETDLTGVGVSYGMEASKPGCRPVKGNNLRKSLATLEAEMIKGLKHAAIQGRNPGRNHGLREPGKSGLPNGWCDRRWIGKMMKIVISRGYSPSYLRTAFGSTCGSRFIRRYADIPVAWFGL